MSHEFLIFQDRSCIKLIPTIDGITGKLIPPSYSDDRPIKDMDVIKLLSVRVHVCAVGAGWGGATSGFVSSSGAAFHESHHGGSVSSPRQDHYH